MREIRTFELEQPDLPTSLQIDRPQRLTVCRGVLWLTIAGESADLWLAAGESIELPPHTTIWVSANQAGGRFNLASATTRATPWRHRLERCAAWLGRRRATAWSL